MSTEDQLDPVLSSLLSHIYIFIFFNYFSFPFQPFLHLPPFYYVNINHTISSFNQTVKLIRPPGWFTLFLFTLFYVSFHFFLHSSHFSYIAFSEFRVEPGISHLFSLYITYICLHIWLYIIFHYHLIAFIYP